MWHLGIATRNENEYCLNSKPKCIDFFFLSSSQLFAATLCTLYSRGMQYKNRYLIYRNNVCAVTICRLSVLEERKKERGVKKSITVNDKREMGCKEKMHAPSSSLMGFVRSLDVYNITMASG